MGKGDRRTAKGKRYNSSYGNTRRHVVSKVAAAPAAPVVVARKVVAKTPVGRKTVAKKAAAKA